MMSDVLKLALVLAGKELTELRRQPGVLLLVVLGPFLVLAAFGLGYRNEELALRTVFVGVENGPYEEAIDAYASSIDRYVVPLAFTTDLFAAIEDLRADRIDLVIVLPSRPSEAVMNNERSEIAVLHNSIDPIEQIGIEFATEVAVRELNATVVTASLDSLLGSVGQLDEDAGSLSPLVEQLESAIAVGDDDAATEAAVSLGARLAEIRPSLELVAGPGQPNDDVAASESNSEESGSQSIPLLADRIDRAITDPGAMSATDLEQLRRDVDVVDDRVSLLLRLEAETLARPFTGDAESLVRASVTPENHVAPGATAMLIQHLAVSLAALSLVRDERRGLLADLRVGPTSILSVILGKLISLTLVSMTGATVLIAGQVFLLGVPQRGSVLSVALIVAGLSFASVGLGLVIASVSRTELYASQAAMISLLIALFFSGFLLDLDRVVAPFSSISLLAPASPAVEGLRLVQLRGVAPGGGVLMTLVVQTLVTVTTAAVLMARKWRST